MIEDKLQQLGFSRKESRVFLSLNKFGGMPASTIARLTQIKRTSVYDILNSLLEKDVISSYRQGNYTYFAVDDLNKIYLYEKEKLRTAKTLVESLQEENKHSQTMQVNYYRGIEGYMDVYQDMLRQNPKDILCWTDINFMSIFSPQQDEEALQERIGRKIPIRILMKDSSKARKFITDDPKSIRETRLLPKQQFQFQTTLFIYDGVIAFYDYRTPITAIRIQHEGIYRMMKEFFEITWPLYDRPH
jgi:sugar-specific transcriptional regulator TrmB